MKDMSLRHHRRSARQHVIPSSWKPALEGEREPPVQKRVALYAETYLPANVYKAMMESSINRKKVTFSEEDIQVYHNVVKGMQNSEGIPDMLRTFKVLDLAYATLNNIEQVVNTIVRSSNVRRSDTKLVQIYTNLMGFRIVHTPRAVEPPGPGANEFAHYYNELIVPTIRYVFMNEAQRTGEAAANNTPLQHYLGPTLDPLYSRAVSSAKVLYSYFFDYMVNATTLDPTRLGINTTACLCKDRCYHGGSARARGRCTRLGRRAYR